ncbi:MAG: hypothetical protein ACP5T4_01930 [Candidatus Micrarchaeia archaeon]
MSSEIKTAIIIAKGKAMLTSVLEYALFNEAARTAAHNANNR